MSVATSNFGPRVSFTTTLADAGPIHVFVPSTGTFTAAGTVNATAAKFLSKSTTASLTSLTLADGEFAVGAVSATSCMIYHRSGVTTYRFLADAATLL